MYIISKSLLLIIFGRYLFWLNFGWGTALAQHGYANSYTPSIWWTYYGTHFTGEDAHFYEDADVDLTTPGSTKRMSRTPFLTLAPTKPTEDSGPVEKYELMAKYTNLAAYDIYMMLNDSDKWAAAITNQAAYMYKVTRADKFSKANEVLKYHLKKRLHESNGMTAPTKYLNVQRTAQGMFRDGTGFSGEQFVSRGPYQYLQTATNEFRQPPVIRQSTVPYDRQRPVIRNNNYSNRIRNNRIIQSHFNANGQHLGFTPALSNRNDPSNTNNRNYYFNNGNNPYITDYQYWANQYAELSQNKWYPNLVPRPYQPQVNRNNRNNNNNRNYYNNPYLRGTQFWEKQYREVSQQKWYPNLVPVNSGRLDSQVNKQSEVNNERLDRQVNRPSDVNNGQLDSQVNRQSDVNNIQLDSQVNRQSVVGRDKSDTDTIFVTNPYIIELLKTLTPTHDVVYESANKDYTLERNVEKNMDSHFGIFTGFLKELLSIINSKNATEYKNLLHAFNDIFHGVLHKEELEVLGPFVPEAMINGSQILLDEDSQALLPSFSTMVRNRSLPENVEELLKLLDSFYTVEEGQALLNSLTPIKEHFDKVPHEAAVKLLQAVVLPFHGKNRNIENIRNLVRKIYEG